MSYKVSILVPIYNVSEFIKGCVTSIFNQTLEDIEFIFINDCTPDDSINILLEVIDDFPHLQDYIKIIHHEYNKGLAAARNTGVENASGEYILHIDSDDRVQSDMAELMYFKALENDADIVVCDYILEWEHAQKTVKYKWNPSPEKFIKMILSRQSEPAVWNKLIRKKLYIDHNIAVPEGMNLGEDLCTTPKLIYFAKKIVKVNKPLYYYNQTNTASYTKRFSVSNLSNAVAISKIHQDFFHKNNQLELYQPSLELWKIRTAISLILKSESKHWAGIHSALGRTNSKYLLNKLNKNEKLIYHLVNNKHYQLLQIYRSSYSKAFRLVQILKGR